MRKTIDLPLHSGRAPKYLLERMVKFCRVVFEIMFTEFDCGYVLERLSDPMWFQSLGCLVGFDWHSSGVTTTLSFAIKEALSSISGSPIQVCGGKGKYALLTPSEITKLGERRWLRDEDVKKLIDISRVVAKVDNVCVQDGFSLYHHSLFIAKDGRWVIIQQGMREGSWARRYHWYGAKLSNRESFFSNPHTGISSDKLCNWVLNLVDMNSFDVRQTIVNVVNVPEDILDFLRRLSSNKLRLPRRHQVLLTDINVKRLEKILLSSYEGVSDFWSVLLRTKIGPKTMRAIALASEIVYGVELSFRDPARFSFAVGGKDGYPYPIDRKHYDEVIRVLDVISKRIKAKDSHLRSLLRRVDALLFDWRYGLSNG